MEPALKQRLLGAAVLVALAVTFLPLLVMDPAPESGASTVPLKVPAAPETGGAETIVLPIGPGAAGPAPAVADPSPADAAVGPATGGTLPPAAAGGDFAVTFGRYATAADAAKVVDALRASQLAAYHEPSQSGARTLHRVLIGPFASRALAESARLRAAHVNDQVAAQVIALDAGATTGTARPTPSVPAAATTQRTTTAAAATPAAVATAPLPSPKPSTSPAATASATTPAAPPPAPTASQPSTPAASSVGFAVQLGAFANADEAARLRDRARAAGFPAFVERVGTADGMLSRVRIGPVTDRAEADRLRAQAAGKLGVGGIVRPHP